LPRSSLPLRLFLTNGKDEQPRVKIGCFYGATTEQRDYRMREGRNHDGETDH
jgi:hypothetical protein